MLTRLPISSPNVCRSDEDKAAGRCDENPDDALRREKEHPEITFLDAAPYLATCYNNFRDMREAAPQGGEKRRRLRFF